MGKRSREKQNLRLQNKEQSPVFTRQRSLLEKICFFIIEWGTYLALFAPFIFIPDYFFPFVVPKTVFFRIVVDIIFIAYILLIISNRKYLPRINILTIAVTVFLGITVLTSILGVNLVRSFWSVFERMTGLLTFFHLYIFFIILTSVFRERKHWERIIVVSILVGVLICFFAWISKEPATRGGSTIGNTSFMAGYLLFNIFFAIILFFTKSGSWKIFSVSVLAILVAGLFISIEPCRGAIGAFFIGLFILGFNYLIFYLFFSGKRQLKRLAYVIIVLLILGGIGILQLDFVKKRIIEEWYGSSIQSRMVVWKMAFEGWKERFWLGWGQDNFNVPFAKYFDPALPLSGDIWYDRVHNIVLDTAIASGILGLMSYLAIFGVAIVGLLRVCPKVIERKNLLFPLGMISLLIAYFIQNLFVFDMISSYMIFFLSLAFVSFLITPKTQENQPAAPPSQMNSLKIFAGAILILISLLTLYFGNIQVARASRYTLQGLSLPSEQAIPAFKKALAVSPISQFETREQLSIRMNELGYQPIKDSELFNQELKFTEEELKKTLIKYPDFRLYLFLGRFYNNVYQFTGNPENLDLAIKTLEKASELSPKNQQVYWSLAQVKLFQAKREEAITLLKKVVDLEPRFGISHWYLGSAYRIAGQYELALAEFKEAEKFGYNWKNNLENLKKVIEVYKIFEDYTNLAPLYEKAVELDPKDADLWGNLADVYAALGKVEKAREAALKLLELKPEKASDVEKFLKDLGY